MAAVPKWTGDDEEPVPVSLPTSRRHRGRRTPGQPFELPTELSSAVWRGSELGSTVTKVLAKGFPALVAELPGAGWPCHALTEILQPQPTVTEWRLLAPAIRQVAASGLLVVIVGPPKSPHLPGLRFAGLDERDLVWVQAETPSERLRPLSSHDRRQRADWDWRNSAAVLTRSRHRGSLRRRGICHRVREH